MSERTMILSTYSNNTTSKLPQTWLGKMFGLLATKFDAIATFVAKAANL